MEITGMWLLDILIIAAFLALTPTIAIILAIVLDYLGIIRF